MTITINNYLQPALTSPPPPISPTLPLPLHIQLPPHSSPCGSVYRYPVIFPLARSIKSSSLNVIVTSGFPGAAPVVTLNAGPLRSAYHVCILLSLDFMSNWKIPFADCERVEPCDFNAVFLLLVFWRKRWRARWEVGRRMEGKRDREGKTCTVLHRNEDL